MILSVRSTLVPEIQHSQLQIGSYGVSKWSFMAFGKVWQQPCKVLDTEPGNQSALCEARMPVLKYCPCLLLEG